MQNKEFYRNVPAVLLAAGLAYGREKEREELPFKRLFADGYWKEQLTAAGFEPEKLSAYERFAALWESAGIFGCGRRFSLAVADCKAAGFADFSAGDSAASAWEKAVKEGNTPAALYEKGGVQTAFLPLEAGVQPAENPAALYEKCRTAFLKKSGEKSTHIPPISKNTPHTGEIFTLPYRFYKGLSHAGSEDFLKEWKALGSPAFSLLGQALEKELLPVSAMELVLPQSYRRPDPYTAGIVFAKAVAGESVSGEEEALWNAELLYLLATAAKRGGGKLAVLAEGKFAEKSDASILCETFADVAARGRLPHCLLLADDENAVSLFSKLCAQMRGKGVPFATACSARKGGDFLSFLQNALREAPGGFLGLGAGGNTLTAPELSLCRSLLCRLCDLADFQFSEEEKKNFLWQYGGGGLLSFLL